MDKRIKQFCPKGHDTFIAGRTARRGECKVCVYLRHYNYKKLKTLEAFAINSLLLKELNNGMPAQKDDNSYCH